MTKDQIDLLCLLAIRGGVTWLRGSEATTAISMAATPYIALGPTEAEGVVSAMLTDEGRAALAQQEEIGCLVPQPGARHERA